MVDISAVITNQYPHYLYKRESGEAVQNDNGSWVEGEASVSLVGVCREETAGRGSKVQTAGGIYREFSSLIQLPAGTTRVAEGTEVFVLNDELEDPTQLLSGDFVEQARISGSVRIAGETLKFDEGRLHCRLWV